MHTVKSVMKTTATCGQPNLVQGLLQIDDDLAAIGKCERDHASHALVVDVGIGTIVEHITAVFNASQQAFSLVQKFKVGHYNRSMLKVKKILVTALTLAGSAAVLSGCGQKGPLYTPDTPASAHRATLPQSLNPWHQPAASQPATRTAETPKPPTRPPGAPTLAPDTLFLTSPSASDATTQ